MNVCQLGSPLHQRAGRDSHIPGSSQSINQQMASTEYTLPYTTLLLMLLLSSSVSVGYITAQNICVKLTKIEIPDLIDCKSYINDEHYDGYSPETCILHSQMYISTKHSKISIEKRYKETLHINEEIQIPIGKFWTFDQKLPDIVQFNLTISYTVGSKIQAIPLDYHLILFHTNMDIFPESQQFNSWGNNQDKQSRIEIQLLNNCMFENGNLHGERNEKPPPPRNNFIVLVNGSVLNGMDRYHYEEHDSETKQEFSITTEPDLNATTVKEVERQWKRLLRRYWPLWLSCVLIALTAIFSVISGICWYFEVSKEQKREKLDDEEIFGKKNLKHAEVPIKTQLRKLSLQLSGHADFIQPEFPLT